jgi:hypothetical protein
MSWGEALVDFDKMACSDPDDGNLGYQQAWIPLGMHLVDDDIVDPNYKAKFEQSMQKLQEYKPDHTFGPFNYFDPWDIKRQTWSNERFRMELWSKSCTGHKYGVEQWFAGFEDLDQKWWTVVGTENGCPFVQTPDLIYFYSHGSENDLTADLPFNKTIEEVLQFIKDKAALFITKSDWNKG